MKQVIWIVVIAAACGLLYGLWSVRRRWSERQRAAEDRFAGFMAQALPSAPAAPASNRMPAAVPQKYDSAALLQQQLLFDAATKAGAAGEAALSIQLYARLLARFPETAFAAQARSAVAAQKKKLAKA
jgi:hypothetical protein